MSRSLRGLDGFGAYPVQMVGKGKPCSTPGCANIRRKRLRDADLCNLCFYQLSGTPVPPQMREAGKLMGFAPLKRRSKDGKSRMCEADVESAEDGMKTSCVAHARKHIRGVWLCSKHIAQVRASGKLRQLLAEVAAERSRLSGRKHAEYSAAALPAALPAAPFFADKTNPAQGKGVEGREYDEEAPKHVDK
eukprot:scaffold8002_cov1862-Pinguiococcus_pyrenoidosus.AAC.1